MENPNNNNQERALARRRGFEEISQTQAAILRSQQGGGLLHFNEDDPWCIPCQLFFLVSHFIIAKVVNDIRKTLSGAILDPEDKIKDVLDDNDFVSIVLETDRPNPSLEQAEVYICTKKQFRCFLTQVRYVTAQVPGGKLTMPEEYLHLDGQYHRFLLQYNEN